MAEADNLPGALTALEFAAKRLEQASSNANQVLATVETRLRDLNVGLELWLTERPLGAGSSPGPHYCRLGYARVDGKWCLAVKDLRDQVLDGTLAAMASPNRGTPQPPTPLLKASRELRSEALALLPILVASLAAQVSKKASDLELAIRPFNQ